MIELDLIGLRVAAQGRSHRMNSFQQIEALISLAARGHVYRQVLGWNLTNSGKEMLSKVDVPAPRAPGCAKMKFDGHLATLVDEMEAWLPTLEGYDDGDRLIHIDDRRSLVSVWENVRAARVAIGLPAEHVSDTGQG